MTFSRLNLANRNFKKGEIVIRYSNLKPLTEKEFQNLPDSEKRFTHKHWGVIYLYPSPARWVNYSSNPNTIQNLKDRYDVAIRYIKKGEEITTDATKDDTNMKQTGKILVLNCGSSSVKWALFTAAEKELCRGVIERIGTKGKTHATAIREILSLLVKKKHLASLAELVAVGHRVVHGGENTKSVLLTNEIMKTIQRAAVLAPLHNPHNIEGIKAIQHLLPSVKNIAVFDTAFHTTIPTYAALYGIPLSLSKKYHIKRYGFHGISYHYICEELQKKCGKLPPRLIVCHLGNGSSMCAIMNGKSIDTSMGFTPLEGLMMGTRCGDIDPGIISHLARMREECRDIEGILNFKSGLKGIAGSNDMRDIWHDTKGNKNARLALDMYCYRLQKYIGAYAAVLGGIDALVFTAGIGEHAWYVRERVCNGLSYLGILLDQKRNVENKECVSSGKVKVFVLPTNEERMIAREVGRLV